MLISVVYQITHQSSLKVHYNGIQFIPTQHSNTSHMQQITNQGLPFLKIITCPTSRILKFFDLLIWNKEEKICSNPLAGLVVLLALGRQAVGNGNYSSIITMTELLHISNMIITNLLNNCFNNKLCKTLYLLSLVSSETCESKWWSFMGNLCYYHRYTCRFRLWLDNGLSHFLG